MPISQKGMPTIAEGQFQSSSTSLSYTDSTQQTKSKKGKTSPSYQLGAAFAYRPRSTRDLTGICDLVICPGFESQPGHFSITTHPAMGGVIKATFSAEMMGNMEIAHRRESASILRSSHSFHTKHFNENRVQRRQHDQGHHRCKQQTKNDDNR